MFSIYALILSRILQIRLILSAYSSTICASQTPYICPIYLSYPMQSDQDEKQGKQDRLQSDQDGKQGKYDRLHFDQVWEAGQAG